MVPINVNTLVFTIWARRKWYVPQTRGGDVHWLLVPAWCPFFQLLLSSILMFIPLHAMTKCLTELTCISDILHLHIHSKTHWFWAFQIPEDDSLSANNIECKYFQLNAIYVIPFSWNGLSLVCQDMSSMMNKTILTLIQVKCTTYFCNTLLSPLATAW